MARRGFSAAIAATNALQSIVEAASSRADRDRLAPGRRPDGPGNWLEALDADECWRLLGTRRLGRLGFTAHSGRLVILPVNYAIDDRRIVIRTGPGPKLEAARRGDFVAFEVDEIDLDVHTGWSVTVTGRARWIREPAELARVGPLDLSTWAAGPRDRVIVVEPSHVGGRRLDIPDVATEDA